jgi:hypothetical protein
MDNITLQQLIEMDETQLKAMLQEVFFTKYQDQKVSKVVLTVNLEKEKTDIVLKF